jgi:hypothetical protein
MLIVVALVMAAVLVASALPAFAAPQNFGHCHKALKQGTFGDVSHSEWNRELSPLKPNKEDLREGARIKCRVS